MLRLVAFLLDVANDIFQHHDGVIDHDAHGKRQRQQGHIVQGEIHHAEQGEGGDDRSRDCYRRDDHGAHIADKQHHHEARQQAAKQKMFLERCNGSFDECGVIANDLNGDSRRQRALELGDLGFGGVNHLQRVGAGLPADIEHHGFFAADHVPGGGIGEAVFDAPHVADANGRVVDIGDDDVVEKIGGFDAAERAHAHLRRAAPDGAAGHFHVLIANGVFELSDGDAVSVQLLGIAENANLPDASAGEIDLADAVDGFQRSFDLLIGDLGGFAQIGAAGDQQGKHGVGVRIVFGDRRRQNRRRQQANGRCHFFADVLRGAFGIAFENEFAGQGGDALVRLRRKFVETADRAHRLFEGKDDLTAHLFRGRARKIDRHRDRGRISLGEKIHAQVPKRKDSENQ